MMKDAFVRGLVHIVATAVFAFAGSYVAVRIQVDRNTQMIEQLQVQVDRNSKAIFGDGNEGLRQQLVRIETRLESILSNQRDRR